MLAGGKIIIMRESSIILKAFMVFAGVILFIPYIFIISDANLEYHNPQTKIWMLSVLAWVEYFICIYTWKKSGNKAFSPYIIFISFAFVFHFGQCFMWALGIHVENEIGTSVLYHSLVAGTPSSAKIIRGQVVCIMGLLYFHIGALLGLRNQNQETLDKTKKEIHEIDYSSLYTVSLVAFIFSAPAALYNELQTAIINRKYGYGAVLYGNIEKASVNVIALLSYMFFASIVGLLISSHYKKSIMKMCYTVFTVYGFLCIMAGDRGEVLFPFIFLMWIHNTLYKKLDARRSFKISIVLLLVVIVLVGVQNMRSSDFSVKTLTNALASDDNPLISMFFELGGTLAVPIILMDAGCTIYPYGNTYLIAIMGMGTEKIVKILIPNYVSVSGWFSQEYLGISYGAGFSMIGEALINFGPYFGMFCLVILGLVYSKIMNFSISEDESPVKIFFKITTAEALVISARNSLISSLKIWFFSTLLICLATYFLSSSNKRRLV